MNENDPIYGFILGMIVALCILAMFAGLKTHQDMLNEMKIQTENTHGK